MAALFMLFKPWLNNTTVKRLEKCRCVETLLFAAFSRLI
jgi:hypothetical protein